MATELVRSAHSIGEYNAHLVLTPAYRRAVFAHPLVRELTTAYLTQKARALGVHIASLEYGPDHLHMFLENWRRHAPAELARTLKGYTSYMLRKGHKQLFEHLLCGQKFWTGGYFFRTVGAVSAETVKKYINESQTKHWKNPAEQKTLLGYRA